MSDESDSPSTRTHAFLSVCSTVVKQLSDPLVDVTGIIALVGLAYSGVGDASLQILTGAIASIALGKRYIGRKQ